MAASLKKKLMLVIWKYVYY